MSQDGMSVKSSRDFSWRKVLKLKGEYHTVVRWGDSFLKLGSWICGVLDRGKNSPRSSQLFMCKGSRHYWLPLSNVQFILQIIALSQRAYLIEKSVLWCGCNFPHLDLRP